MEPSWLLLLGFSESHQLSSPVSLFLLCTIDAASNRQLADSERLFVSYSLVVLGCLDMARVHGDRMLVGAIG